MEMGAVAQWLAESVLKQLKEMRGFKKEREELKMRVSTIKSALLVAEKDPEGGEKFREWGRKVRDVLYLTEDLLDEYATDLAMSQLQEYPGNKVLKEISFYLTHFNQFLKNNHMSYELAGMSDSFDGILRDYYDLIKSASKTVSHKPSSEEEGIQEEDVVVVGREREMSEILDLLTADDDMSPVVTLVGVGGLGKSTLARLVYNHSLVTLHFDLQIWVDVSKSFDANTTLVKILSSLTGGSPPPTDLDSIQAQLLSLLSGKNFLLVLDDMWSESTQQCLPLKQVLFSDSIARGSRTLITSRSRKVAKAMGCSCVYDLPFLSENDSWQLFQNTAFRQPPSGNDVDFARLGEDIAAKCAGLPLALVAVGTLLNGQGKDRWLSFRDTDFACLSPVKNLILPRLKRSYDHLSLPLKNCFLYCSLFPSSYPIEKDQLISMWMAQGFIHPVPDRTLEEVGADYFETLRQHCFFQGLKEDTYGEVLSFRLHDLMRILAKDIAQREISVASSITNEVSGHIRHVSVVDQNLDAFLDSSSIKRIRTFANFFFPVPIKGFMLTCITDARRLRLLDLRHCNLTGLPSSVGNLIQLRYLNLSSNPELAMLPMSVTNLYDLQALYLRDCSGLLDLPCGLSKLLNLRSLDISGCYKLTHMPLNMGKMTNLHMLSAFVLGNMSYASTSEQLENLKSLSYLTSDLTVRLLEYSAVDSEKAKEAGYLKAKSGLVNLSLHWGNDNAQYGDSEALLEGLEPHSSLKRLTIKGYPGVRFSWASLVNSSSTNLVRVCLVDCPRLKRLPQLSQLQHLHELVLDRLPDLEFVEAFSYIPVGSLPVSRASKPVTFLPSLEKLRLCNLPKLVNLWRLGGETQGTTEYSPQVDGTCGDTWFLSLPRVEELIIRECPILTSVPFCPRLRKLELYKFSEALKLFASSCSSLLLQQKRYPLLTRLTIDDVGYLSSQPLKSYQYLSSVTIQLSDQEQLSSSKKKFGSLMPSLQSLEIKLCCKLRSLSHPGWDHLGALQKLCLSNLPVMDLTASNADGEEDGMPWKLFSSLHSLELDYLPKLVELPRGIHCLTTLRSLEIRSCHNLKALPDWISCLTDLQVLYIKACSGLIHLPESMMNLTSLRMLEVLRCSRYFRKKCQQPTGEDWPKIRHIPRILID